MSEYVLEPLTSEQASLWDNLISDYGGREVFHRRAWLDYLVASRGVATRFWAIRRGNHTVGYFCGGVLRKGPFRMLGSPLKGWGTNAMGPVAKGEFEADDFLHALEDVARQEGWAMTELETPLVQAETLTAFGYVPTPALTFIVRLTSEPEPMWRSVDGTRRTGIRKAVKAGLTVEDTDDPDVADEFYDQYVDLMRRKGQAPPYPRTYPRLLVKHLRPAGLLFALRVRDAQARVVATGLFPHDDRTMYFWGGASWTDARALCPNDLLHWTAMRMAGERGLTRYDMSGNGRFKQKFGGTLAEVRRWHRCHSRSARWARQGYETLWRVRNGLVSRWARLVSPR